MSIEEKKWMLLALAPLLHHPPPIVQTSQLLYSMVETADVVSGSADAASMALVVMDLEQMDERPPCPA
jgi:hypothetical protein